MSVPGETEPPKETGVGGSCVGRRYELRMGETRGSVVLVVIGWLVGWLGWVVVGGDEFIMCVNLNGNILQRLEGFNDMPAAFCLEKRSQILKAVKPTPSGHAMKK